MRLDIGKFYKISEKLKKAFDTIESEAKIVSISGGIVILQINMQSYPLKESIAHENLSVVRTLSARYKEKDIVENINKQDEIIEIKKPSPTIKAEEEPVVEEEEPVVEEELIIEEVKNVISITPEINNEKQETIEENPEDNNESNTQEEPANIWDNYNPDNDEFF